MTYEEWHNTIRFAAVELLDRLEKVMARKAEA